MERCPDDITLSYKQSGLSPMPLGTEVFSIKAGTGFFCLQGECNIHMSYVF